MYGTGECGVGKTFCASKREESELYGTGECGVGKTTMRTEILTAELYFTYRIVRRWVANDPAIYSTPVLSTLTASVAFSPREMEGNRPRPSSGSTFQQPVALSKPL